MFKSNSYDENRLWWWYKELEENQSEKEKTKDLEAENLVERRKQLTKRINTAINNINHIMWKLRQDADFRNTVNNKIKWASTFDACWVIIWEIEKFCDKSYIPLLEEYRYCVNTAKQDKELMSIIEENLKICLELNNIKRPTNSSSSERSNTNPFWTTFYKSY